MRASGAVRRREWIIVLCLLSVAPLFLTCWVHGDGIGYVAVLRSAVVDHDLELADEFAHLSSRIEADASGLPSLLLSRGAHRPGIDPAYQRPAPDPVTGRVPSNYSIGPALAWAPAYLVAHGITRLTRAAGGARRADGYGGLYYLAIAASSLAFGVLGLLIAYRLACGVTPAPEAQWSVLAMAWASPLLYYLYFAPSYSHALSVFAVSAFFLYWWRSRHDEGAGAWFRWGALAGVMFLVRWNDVVLALPAFAAAAGRVLAAGGPRSRGARLSRLMVCGGAAALGLVLVAAPQLAVWQYFHGRPWVRHPADYVGFFPAGLWGTLFSARHGLFVWTPVAIPAVAGLFLLFRRDRELAAVSLAALALLVIANCTVRDWWGGASFGMRRLVSGTPLLILGFAVFLEDARGALARREGMNARVPGAGKGASRAWWLAPLAAFALTGWNLLLLGQYALGMISHSGPVPLATIAANQPRVVARMIQIAGEVLR